MTRQSKEPNTIDSPRTNTSTPKRSPVTPNTWFNDYTPSPKSKLTPNTFYTSPPTSSPTPNPASTPAWTHAAPSTSAPPSSTQASPVKTPLTPTPTPTSPPFHRPSTPSPSDSEAPPDSNDNETLPILNAKSDPDIQIGVFTGLGQRKPETLRRGREVGREQAIASRRAIRRLRDLCGGF